MSSTGEDELEDVLSDVDEVPKSKKKKKAKKSSRESRSSKRQRPVREVSLLFVTLLLFAFYFASGRHFFNCPGECWNASLNNINITEYKSIHNKRDVSNISTKHKFTTFLRMKSDYCNLQDNNVIMR